MKVSEVNVQDITTLPLAETLDGISLPVSQGGEFKTVAAELLASSAAENAKAAVIRDMFELATEEGIEQMNAAGTWEPGKFYYTIEE